MQVFPMGFGKFIAHGTSARVRITSPAEGLAYAHALPAAAQARPHWQAAIAAAANADETETLLDNARDALRNALLVDRLYIRWSE